MIIDSDIGSATVGGLSSSEEETVARGNFGLLKKTDPDKLFEHCSKGGRAAHEKGTAHEWTVDEAREAGRKGGQVTGERRRARAAAARQVAPESGAKDGAASS